MTANMNQRQSVPDPTFQQFSNRGLSPPAKREDNSILMCSKQSTKAERGALEFESKMANFMVHNPKQTDFQRASICERMEALRNLGY
jgi:hypothetical protein